MFDVSFYWWNQRHTIKALTTTEKVRNLIKSIPINSDNYDKKYYDN